MAAKSIVKRSAGAALALAAAVACAALSGRAASAQETPAPAAVSQRVSGVILPGDKLNIRVYREEELTGVWHGSSVGYAVDAEGDLNFPLVGSIRVEGMRLEELQKKLTELLDQYIVNPQVSISFYEKETKAKVSIMGQVVRTGNYDYVQGMTIMQLVAEAGGFVQPEADRIEAGQVPDVNRVQITRQMASGADNVRIVDAQAIMDGKAPDVALEPSDLVIVPSQQNILADPASASLSVSVLGQVNMPGNYDVSKTGTLVRLISDARGFTRLAAQDRVMLTRSAAGAGKSVSRVNAEAIMRGAAEDISLMPGDVIYVPESEF